MVLLLGTRESVQIRSKLPWAPGTVFTYVESVSHSVVSDSLRPHGL